MACATCSKVTPAAKVLPSRVTMAVHATKAAGRVVKAAFQGRAILVSPQIFRQRMAKCLACPNCLPDKNPQYHRCALCGCFLDRKNKVDAKAWLATERCELGQWEASA